MQKQRIAVLEQEVVNSSPPANEGDIRNQLASLSEQLHKERSLNNLINSQLLDTEKSLRDEQAKRKLVEDKLFSVSQQKHKAAQAADSESQQHLLELANAEIARKELSLRDARRKNEIFEGHNLDKRSRPELIQI